MKIFKVIFGVCLGVLALYSSHATTADDMVRAATRSGTPNITSGTVRGGQSGTQKATAQRTTGPRDTTRGTNATAQKATDARAVAKSRPTTTQNVIQRSGASDNIVTRTNAQKSATRTLATRNAARTATRPTTLRGAATAAATRKARTAARAATSESGIRTSQYQKCREIYYECMDEFCANKDANLRRCACSKRATEFDSVKQQISQVEDKMLDFNQRLLMVNMDAKDVDAINTATAGEDAYYATKDKTKSKQTLDDISKKLNGAFDDTGATGSGLSAISLSLNADTAFDSVNSLYGANTVTKTGVALYNAAIPICREMAMEICTDEEFSLAVSGYQMQIEQDCNTVSKAYQSKVDQTRTKVFESGALLDISRLDAYQTRNSDDILTCKKKMLDLLYDNAVCGTNMEKCLDITGRYIDPSTGTAFLTPNLSDLETLIARPENGQSWVSVNSGNAFLTYLKDKKTYLESATQNCQDIADKVWDAFIEDALAQIKLAQGAKLQEIRQACTTLTTECLTNASDSITDFDARALSIFGVAATKTALAMCADVQTACDALLGAEGDTSWATGISDANTIKTYESIISSCTLVGQNCIIQACRSISGNFGLCEDVEFAANRHAILERTSCWNEVLNCVASAGENSIMSAINLLGKSASGSHKYAFYDDIYGTNTPAIIYDICANECADGVDDAVCAKCRISERIWGNCQYNPSSTENDQNQILTSTNASTLLMWFAKNTHTEDNVKNCLNVRCTAGNMHLSSTGQMICIADSDMGDVTDDGRYCPVPPNVQMSLTNTADSQTNCCFDGSGSEYIPNTGATNSGICCENGHTVQLDNKPICVPTDVTNIKAVLTRASGNTQIICIGANQVTGGGAAETDYPNGRQVRCNGTFIEVQNGNNYFEPTKSGSSTGGTRYTPAMYYYDTNATTPTTLSPTNNIINYFVGYNISQ
ncbi:MAG: hypothetical protein J5611_03895 [Alphaproteobacteria bacterium]|nr:hypothetical protein [Alphaproteobacteria bacterium]